MSVYTVKNNSTGQTITFQWHGVQPPTDADMEEVFAEAASAQPGGGAQPTTMSTPTLATAQAAEAAANRPITMRDVARGAVEALPGVGAMAGGAVGAFTGPGAPLAIPAGAGLGAGAGEALRQMLAPMLGGQAPQGFAGSATGVAREAMLGAAGDMGGAVAGKLLAPWAAKLSPTQRAVAAAVEREGLPISPDQISPGRTAQALQGIVDNIPAGRLRTTLARNRLSDGLERMYEDAARSLPMAGQADEAGQTLLAGVRDATKAKVQAGRTAYGAAREAAGGADAMIDMTNTAKFVQENINSLRDPNLLKKFREVQKKIGKEGAAPARYLDVERWLQWGRDKTNPIQAKLKEAIYSDLDDSIVTAHQAATNQFRQMKEFTSNPTISNIRRSYNAEPDEIIGKAFRAGNIKDVSILKQELPPNVFDEAATRFVEKDLLGPAMRVEGTRTVFQPNVYAAQFDRYAKQIKNTMPEDVYNALEMFAQVARASSADIERQSLGTLSKSLMGLQLAGGAAAMASGAGAATVVVPNSFALVAAQSMMNPKGWLRKWLTTGLMQDGGREALRVGGRSIPFVSRGTEGD